MKKTNLTIVRKSVSIIAEEEKNGNTIMYAYEHQMNETPQNIGFTVYRKQEGQPKYQGQVAIQGNVFPDGNFSVQNQSYQRGDATLYEHIHDVCQELLTSTEIETEEISENES